MKEKKGFTLVEVMIVAAIIGLILAIAIPNFVKARETAQQNVCVQNMRQIMTATQVWSIDLKKAGTDVPTTGDLVDNYMRKWPACPKSGAAYEPQAVSANPVCPTDPVNHHL